MAMQMVSYPNLGSTICVYPDAHVVMVPLCLRCMRLMMPTLPACLLRRSDSVSLDRHYSADCTA